MANGSEQVHKGISSATLKHIYWAFYFYLFLFIYFFFSVGLLKKGVGNPTARERTETKNVLFLSQSSAESARTCEAS